MRARRGEAGQHNSLAHRRTEGEGHVDFLQDTTEVFSKRKGRWSELYAQWA